MFLGMVEDFLYLGGWGRNNDGEATPPAELTDVISIASGDYFALALRSDGTVVGWGRNDYDDTEPPEDLQGVIAIAAGSNHSVALKEDGSVIVWGNSTNGQHDIPNGLTDVISIAATDMRPKNLDTYPISFSFMAYFLFILNQYTP